MLIKKFFVILFCVLSSGQVFAQTASDKVKTKSDVTVEVQEKALALLKNLARETGQFSLPSNRISSQTQVADLLWASDEKRAREIFQTAITELNLMFGQIPPESPEPDDEAATARYIFLNDIKTLRSELLLALAARDPKLALETMQLLSRKTEDGKDLFEDDQALELNLAAQIVAKDPKQAYEIAKKNLEKGLGYNLFSTLENIYKADAEIGAKLAQDIFGKIKSKDTTISSTIDALSNATNGMMNSNVSGAVENNGFVVNVWEIQTFLETIKKLNRQAAKNKKSNLLSDNETKELIEILAQKFVRQEYLSSYEVAKLMPEITKYFPALAQAIRAKIGQTEAATLNNLVNAQTFQDDTEDKSTDEILKIIEKKPIAERDDLYWAAAQKAFTDGDIQDAKKFYAKIKTKREYDYLDKQIDSALPLSLAEKGDLSEVRQMLAKLKSPEERIEVLTALAITVAKSGDKKIAAALLDESRLLYSGKMKNRKNLTSVLQLAQAAAAIEPEQGFLFLESNISYFNNIISAAVLLNEFNDYGAVENDELRLETVRIESYRNAPKAVRLVKNLAVADFDRTVGLAEKFSRSEVRFLTRLRIAEALLDPTAEEAEKDFQANLGEEHDVH